MIARGSKLFVDLGSRRPSLPLGVSGAIVLSRKRKAARSSSWEQAWRSQLSLGVLLLKRNGFIEYQPQTRPLYKCNGQGKKKEQNKTMTTLQSCLNTVTNTSPESQKESKIPLPWLI